MDPVELKVKNYIINYNLLCDGDKVLLSLSAGKDSMAMLNIIQNLTYFFNIEIIAFHLNHLMRGEESDDDEIFLKEKLDNEKIKLICQKYDFSKNKNPKLSFEEYARNIRYEFLMKIYESEKCNKIITAHNYQDNIETLLMRIFTGTGIFGLSGIEKKRGHIIRPLLEITVPEIYDYLNRNKLKWREDKTNNSNDYSRNYVRNIIIPEIKKKFPMFDNSLMNLSKISSDTIFLINELMVDKLDDLYHYEGEALLISAKEINESEKIFNYIMIKILREEFNFYCTIKIVNEIYRNFQQNKSNNKLYQNDVVQIEKIYKNENIWIKINKSNFQKNIKNWEYVFNLYKNYENFALNEIGIEITLHFVDYTYFINNKNNNKCIFVTFDDKINTISIRNRRKGDIISLNYGTKKIKDLLIEKKLDNISKNIVPLLIIDTNIASFMPGLVFNINNKISKDYIVKNDSKKVLAIEVKT